MVVSSSLQSNTIQYTSINHNAIQRSGEQETYNYAWRIADIGEWKLDAFKHVQIQDGHDVITTRARVQLNRRRYSTLYSILQCARMLWIQCKSRNHSVIQYIVVG